MKCILQGATTSSSASVPTLYENLQRATWRSLSGSFDESSYAVSRIHDAEKIKFRIICHFIKDVSNFHFSDKLIGHEDSLEAMTPSYAELLHRGNRNAPGTIVELALEKLRAHCGLAMRAQQSA